MFAAPAFTHAATRQSHEQGGLLLFALCLSAHPCCRNNAKAKPTPSGVSLLLALPGPAGGGAAAAGGGSPGCGGQGPGDCGHGEGGGGGEVRIANQIRSDWVVLWPPASKDQPVTRSQQARCCWLVPPPHPVNRLRPCNPAVPLFPGSVLATTPGSSLLLLGPRQSAVCCWTVHTRSLHTTPNPCPFLSLLNACQHPRKQSAAARAQMESSAAQEAELEGRLRSLRQKVAALRAEATGARSASATVQVSRHPQ